MHQLHYYKHYGFCSFPGKCAIISALEAKTVHTNRTTVHSLIKGSSGCHHYMCNKLIWCYSSLFNQDGPQSSPLKQGLLLQLLLKQHTTSSVHSLRVTFLCDCLRLLVGSLFELEIPWRSNWVPPVAWKIFDLFFGFLLHMSYCLINILRNANVKAPMIWSQVFEDSDGKDGSLPACPESWGRLLPH